MNFVELVAQNVACITTDGDTTSMWCLWSAACEPHWWGGHVMHIMVPLRDLQAHVAAREPIWNWRKERLLPCPKCWAALAMGEIE